jgi:hypothetical protein
VMGRIQRRPWQYRISNFGMPLVSTCSDLRARIY